MDRLGLKCLVLIEKKKKLRTLLTNSRVQFFLPWQEKNRYFSNFFQFWYDCGHYQTGFNVLSVANRKRLSLVDIK